MFRITSDISRQVFPLTLDLANPEFKRCLDRLLEIARASADAKAQGGMVGKAKQALCAASAAFAFARLYLLRSKPNPLPAEIRLAPVW